MPPRFSTADREILRRVSAWPQRKNLEQLDAQVLCQISKSHGIDFATALLYDAIRTSPAHGPFVDRMNAFLDDDSMQRCELDATVVIVPGAFYREHPETGADGKNSCRMAQQMGCRTNVIPTESVGSAACNGRIICDWLLNESNGPTVLCSLSKGSADVKMALSEKHAADAFRNVTAWLNVGGIPSGSPMAAWLLERPLLAYIYRTLFWMRGQDFEFVRQLARRSGSCLDFKVSVPPHVKVIHVLGFPLAHHLSGRRTSRWLRRLSCYGPNDGAAVLADSCELPGLIFPVWGEDHYLNNRHSPEQLLRALLHYLADDFSAVQSRSVPAALAEVSAFK